MPKVSIVMAVYNAELTVASSLRSIQNQTLTDIEIIVVDDGSTDGTPAILEAAAAVDPRIIQVRKEHSGLTSSLNVGLRLASADYIARQDADDLSLPHRLERQLLEFKDNPTLGALGCSVRVVDDAGILVREVCPAEVGNLNRALRSRNRLVHGSLMFRAAALRRVNGYNEDFKCAQDYDLLLRIGEQWVIGAVPECLYEWRRSRAGISSRRFFEQMRYAARAKALAAARIGRFSRRVPLNILSSFKLLPTFVIDYRCGLPKVVALLRRWLGWQ